MENYNFDICKTSEAELKYFNYTKAQLYEELTKYADKFGIDSVEGYEINHIIVEHAE
jgi:hypothetical protein